MSVDRLDTKIRGPIPDPTPEDQRRAALTIAHHATSPEECLELLRMVGLVDPGFEWTGSVHYGAEKRRKITKEAS